MRRDQLPGSNDWRVDDVPGDEPRLHFVGTDTSLTSKSLVPVGLRVLKKGQRFIDDLEPVRGRVALDGRRRSAMNHDDCSERF